MGGEGGMLYPLKLLPRYCTDCPELVLSGVDVFGGRAGDPGGR
jgi:hypothetical protein